MQDEFEKEVTNLKDKLLLNDNLTEERLYDCLRLFVHIYE